MKHTPIKNAGVTNQTRTTSGTGSGTNVQLRGLSYAQGAKLLSPVQCKEEELSSDEYWNGTAETKKAQYDRNSGKTGNTIHDNRLEGKTAEGKFEDTYGKYDAGTGATLSELWDAVAAVALMTAPEGACHFAEVEGKLNLLFAEIATKFELEIADKGAKMGIKGKLDFGSSLVLPVAQLSLFAPKLKATFGGAYEVDATGDTPHECFRLMQLGVRAAMKADANAMFVADEAERTAALQSKGTAEGSAFLGAIQWVWRKIKNAAAAISAPDDYAEYQLSRFIDTVWNGDAGLDYDARAAAAIAEMGEGDGVEVKRERKASAGVGLGDEESASLSGEMGAVTESVTKLDATNAAQGGATETKDLGLLKVEGALNLEKLAGLKGKFEYERKAEDKGHSEGELKVEIEGGVSNWGAAAVAIGATIFSKIFPYVSTKNAGPGALDGFGQAVFTNALVTGTVGVEQGIAKQAADHATHGGHGAAGEHGHAAEVGLELKWKHSPWAFEGCEVKIVKPIFEAGLLGSKVGAKMGTKYELPAPGHGGH